MTKIFFEGSSEKSCIYLSVCLSVVVWWSRCCCRLFIYCTQSRRNFTFYCVRPLVRSLHRTALCIRVGGKGQKEEEEEEEKTQDDRDRDFYPFLS